MNVNEYVYIVYDIYNDISEKKLREELCGVTYLQYLIWEKCVHLKPYFGDQCL